MLFEHTEVTASEARATGIVVWVEQTVEPLRVELVLDLPGRALASGSIRLGDTTRDVVEHGSREHGRLVNQILLDPRRSFDWRESFRRDASGWRRDPRP